MILFFSNKKVFNLLFNNLTGIIVHCHRAQGALEYMIIIGGAVLIAAMLIVLMTSSANPVSENSKETVLGIFCNKFSETECGKPGNDPDMQGSCLFSDCEWKEGICSAKPPEQRSQACFSGEAPPIPEGCFDNDEDGFLGWNFENCQTGPDCNDTDPKINPGAEEICDDEKDNDCDFFFVDCRDYDCLGDPACPEVKCGIFSPKCCDEDKDDFGIEGSFLDPCYGNTEESDCNDSDSAIFPGATELCGDEKDNDCDLKEDCDDEDCTGSPYCFEHCDNGVEDADETGTDCGGSCVSGNEAFCSDSKDNDSDCLTDCADADCFDSEECAEEPCTDLDSDGFGAEGTSLVNCAGSSEIFDCDDSSAETNPDASEICDDFIDNDCDGLTDSSDSECNTDPENVLAFEVLVVVNDSFEDRDGNGKSDSVEVGEHYSAQRKIPSKNICHVSCSSEDIASDLAGLLSQIQACLETDSGGMLLKNKIYYIVPTLGIPFKTSALESVDHKIECIYLANWQVLNNGNRLYYKSEFQDSPHRFKPSEKERRLLGESPQYLVSRLDGPTLEIAKGLVDKAVYAEQHFGPVFGNAYIDASITPEGNTGTGELFYNVSDALSALGIPVFVIPHTELGTNFLAGECPKTAYYWGWYQHFLLPRFEWIPGGIGAELQSYSAKGLRSGRRAVPIMLHEGITGTIGWVNEPYYETDLFGKGIIYFAEKGLDFAEATHLANFHPNLVRIGDPLYSLHRHSATRQADSSAPIISNASFEVKDNRVYFFWETDEVSKGFVEFGETIGYGNTVTEKFNRIMADSSSGYNPKYFSKRHGLDAFHSVSLGKELLPDTEYHFRVTAIDASGNSSQSTDFVFSSPASGLFSEAWDPNFVAWGYHSNVNYDSQFAGKSIRNWFGAGRLIEGGSFVRIKLTGSSSRALNAGNFFIGEAENAGFSWQGDNYTRPVNIVAGTGVPILFSGSASVSLSPGQSIWSDWIEFDFDKTKDYSISFFVDSADSGIARVCSDAGSNAVANSWVFEGDVSSETDWASLITADETKLKAANGDFMIYGIESIEVK